MLDISGFLLTAGLLLGTTDIIKGKNDEKKIKERWKTAMVYAGIKNKSEEQQTFELLKVIKKQYGYDCLVSIPYGLSYEELEKIKPIIQTNLQCYGITMEWKVDSGCAYVRLITVPFDEKAPFEPVKVNPWELYISSTEYYKDIITDLRIHPHVLVSGATGSGKSVLIFMLILNTIVNHTPNDVNIYLSQVSDKKDLRIFDNLPHVKYFANDLEKSAKMLIYLTAEMKKRNELINQYKNVNNLYEYNQRFPKDKLPYIYLFTDEFAFYMPDDLDSDEEVNYKLACLTCYNRLAKEARSTGIYIITGLQRPDKESMPPIFKSLLCTRVAFPQNNTASSLVVIDDGEAVNLNPREAIVLMGNKREKVKTPYLDMDMIESYLADYANDNSNYINVDHIEVPNRVNEYRKQQQQKSKNKKKNNKNNNNNNNNDDNNEQNKNNQRTTYKNSRGVIE